MTGLGGAVSSEADIDASLSSLENTVPHRTRLRIEWIESRPVIGRRPLEESTRLSNTGRYIGLALTAAMFAFSSWVFLQTGDWVAAVFAAGSLAYGLFFLTRGGAKS